MSAPERNRVRARRTEPVRAGGGGCTPCGSACIANGALCSDGTPQYCCTDSGGTHPCCDYGSPLIVDPLNEGFHLTSLSDGTRFSLDRHQLGMNDFLRRNPHMTERSMNRLLMAYLAKLPGAVQEVELTNGEKVKQCIFSPHSLRATTATLLLDAGEAIESVQELLDHKHITTTQIYDKRRRSVRDSASHKVPI
jgi:hypothetical protein